MTEDTTKHLYVPPSTESGGTTLGNSYLTTWARCPRDWYWNYFHRTDTEDVEGSPETYRGVSPWLTKLPFLSGRIVHDGLEWWYRSGCRDGDDTGEYDIDVALAHAEAAWKKAEREYPDEDVWHEDWDKAETLLRKYHDAFGPDGPNPDWPTIRVVCDINGEPLAEREWRSKLAPGYMYTCRTDLVIYHRGYLKTMEHKTSVPGFIGQRLRTIEMDSQFTGEYWALAQGMPDEDLAGVLINVIAKGNSPKWGAAARETTTRTDAQLEQWRRNSISILTQINDAVGGFEAALEAGREWEDALFTWFPDQGTRTGQCTAFNSYCAHKDLCQNPGSTSNWLDQFRPRLREETSRLMEGL